MYPSSFLKSLYVVGSVRVLSLGPQVCAVTQDAFVAAFVDVNVVPMDSERVIAHQTVVVEGGQVAAFGQVSKVKVPAGAVIIDGQGKYLIPGLTDMHYHPAVFSHSTLKFVQDSLFRDVASGVTAVRFISGGPDSVTGRMFNDGVPSPRMFRSSEAPMPTKPGDVVTYVAEAKASGSHFIGIDNTPFSLEIAETANSPQERVGFDALVAAARRSRLPLASHDHTAIFGKLLTIGPAGGSIEHLYPLLSALGYPVDTWTQINEFQNAETLPIAEGKLRDLARALARTGVWVTPTLQCSESKRTFGLGQVKLMRQLVKSLQDAEVGLLAAGDDGHAVRDDLAVLVRAGLTPYQALVTATRNPAQYFGMLDSAGTVAVGKRADLVLLPGNPLADIHHLREPVGVMLAGRWFDQATLDQGILASPRYWEWLTIHSYPGFTEEQQTQLTGDFRRKLKTSVDALAAAKPSEAQHARQSVGAVLGDIHAFLAPEQQVVFDPRARVWLREQARKGHRVAVAGITETP